MASRYAGDFIVDPDYSSPLELSSDYVVVSERDGEEIYSANFVARPDETSGTVEQTQSIQFFPSFHPDGFVSPGRDDNDVKLIEGKTTILRVYLTPASGFGAGSDVRGRAYIRSYGTQSWGSPLPDYNGPIRIRPRSQIRRANEDHTLNFRIPKAACSGALEVRIDAYDVARTQSLRTVAFREIVFQIVKPLNLFLWGIWSPLRQPEPSRAEILQLLEVTRRSFPTVLVNDPRNYDVFVWAGPPDSQQGWEDLHRYVQDRRTDRGNDGTDVDVAVFRGSEGGHTGFFRRTYGWGGGRVAVSVARQTVIAHEVGHALGRGHVIGCDNDNLSNPDDNYPRYFGRRTGTIGEYGMDTETGRVLTPGEYRDTMTYCDDRWTSPYTYEGLLQRWFLKP